MSTSERRLRSVVIVEELTVATSPSVSSSSFEDKSSGEVFDGITPVVVSKSGFIVPPEEVATTAASLLVATPPVDVVRCEVICTAES